MYYCYKRHLWIEGRLLRTVQLIESQRMNANTLAEEFGVSRQTVFRMVSFLRRKGYVINVVRDSEGWRYEVVQKPKFVLIPIGKVKQNPNQQPPSNQKPSMPINP